MVAAADLILHGGPILTMETAQPRAVAIAIAVAQIVAVGARASLMPMATSPMPCRWWAGPTSSGRVIGRQQGPART
jgi:hypothetical protein